MAIDISVNPSYSGNFDFSLMNYEYFNLSDGKAKHQPHDVISDFNGTRIISYESILTPGTYFIYLRGRQTSSIYNDLPYLLDIEVAKVAQSPNISISDMRDVNHKGAIWLSDFIPANNFSIFDLNTKYVYYNQMEQNLNYPDYALDELREISNGSPIKLATYFIWDPVLKHTLFSIFSTLKTELNSLLVTNEEISGELTLLYNQVDGTLNLVMDIVGYTLLSLPIALGVDIISYIGFNALNVFFQSISPKFKVSDAQYLAYICALTAYMDLGLTEEEGSSPDKILEKDDGRVIQIPIFYTLGVDECDFPTFNQHYFSLKATSSEFFNYTSLIYSDDFISSSYSNDFYCRGKIYSISNFEDLTDLSALVLAEPHTHHYEGHYCTTCGEYTSSHDYREFYTYIDTRSHRSYCDCGEYSLMPHVVASGSFDNGQRFATCLLCGGRAEKGFVQNSKSMLLAIASGESYILPNGVVVLCDEDLDAFINGTLII